MIVVDIFDAILYETQTPVRPEFKNTAVTIMLQNRITIAMKKALRETQTLRALAVVRFGHRPPARPPARPPQTHPQTHRQDRLQYTAPLASAQCNKRMLV